MEVRLQGTFLSAPAPRDYDFNDESGRQVAGTTRKAYVLQSEGSAPVTVKFDGEFGRHFDKVRAMKFGEPVDWMVDTATRDTVKFRDFAPAK